MPDEGKDQHGHVGQSEFLNSLRSNNGIPLDRHTHTDLDQAERYSHIARWLALATIVIGLDQASKLWVLSVFYLNEIYPLTNFLNLTLVFNPGAAFSFLADAGGWQKWFFLALAIAVSLWVINTIRREPNETKQAAALTLIMGGALGNAIDRVAYGAVVDFLDVYWQYWHWPAFNVADSAICIGAILLVWDQMTRKPVKQTSENTGSSA
ncbi:MAG: hypothetical protein RIR18_1722 [Pseudomonadota bacterium]|jgi:signal peptidase II